MFNIKNIFLTKQTFSLIKTKFKNSYNNYRKFTIIRNPYDKMVSWYFYLKRNLNSNTEVLDFNDWVVDPTKLWHANDPISFLDPQCRWVDDTVELIRFENINEELNIFFGEKIDLPITNKTDHKHYLKYYNTESLYIIYVNLSFKKYLNIINIDKICHYLNDPNLPYYNPDFHE